MRERVAAVCLVASLAARMRSRVSSLICLPLFQGSLPCAHDSTFSSPGVTLGMLRPCRLREEANKQPSEPKQQLLKACSRHVG